MSAAQIHALPGGRWHGQHGPIDLVVGADGEPAALQAAHAAAQARFAGVLGELVVELPQLRQPVQGLANPLQGDVARRMWAACRAVAGATPDGFITPMAAVAGAVAQELVAAYRRPGIARAWVNNGGDIALHLAPGAQATVGLFADLAAFDGAAAAHSLRGRLPLDGRFSLRHGDAVRGIATSGWRGRSFSLGIADSVTVLAADAASADAAATVIANAVDLPGDTRIVRRPASALRDDSDLGERAVTVQVPALPAADTLRALRRGLACAHVLQSQGAIHAALLVCQGQALQCTSAVQTAGGRLAPQLLAIP